MPGQIIACAGCSQPVPSDQWNRENASPCPWCGQPVQALVFPAFQKKYAGAAPTAIEGEAEASCYYHPQSRASIPCEECGRFLCALCDLDVEGRHICPRCFESGVKVHKIATAEPRRMMYDTMALAMSTFPILLFWPALICAPWSLFLVFRRWNAPGSVVPRTKIRFILAALFALAEIAFFIFIIYILTIVNQKRRR